MTLSVDCMGGDHGTPTTLPACQRFLQAHPEAELILVGRAEALKEAASWERCRIVSATEVVEMTDTVEVALRKKKDSSMRVALAQLKGRGWCRARGAGLRVGRQHGVRSWRSLATCSRRSTASIVLPSPPSCRTSGTGYTTVLDLGANVDCTAEHLLQFAVMGSALVSAVEGKENPSVGLLNIGEEVIKGSETIKHAAELLRAAA